MREHTFSYRVNVYDVDAFGELSAVALLGFLQQAASDASAAVGFDIEWYDQQGALWLIRRTQIERFAPAAYRDVICVRTWVSDIRRVRSQRAYEMRRDRDGLLLAQATTDWVYVDSRRATPVSPPQELQLALMPDGVVTHDRPPRRVPRVPSQAFHTDRRVVFSELDSVAHVNNAQYAGYLEQDLYDALAAHGWSIDPLVRTQRPCWNQLDLEYFEPALYTDTLDGRVWVTEIANPRFSCEHTLERAGRRVLSARTGWHWSNSTPPEPLLRAIRALHEAPTS